MCLILQRLIYHRHGAKQKKNPGQLHFSFHYPEPPFPRRFGGGNAFSLVIPDEMTWRCPTAQAMVGINCYNE